MMVTKLSLHETEYNRFSTLLLPLCAFLLFDFIQLNMMGAVSDNLLHLLSLSKLELGLISSLFFSVNLILLIPAGMLLDYFSPKWLVIISIFVALFGICFFTWHFSVTNAVIWRSCAGVAGAFSYLSCVKIIATNFPSKCRGLLIGGTGIVIMAAGVIAQYPVTWAIVHYGLRTVLVADIILGLIVIIIMYMFLQAAAPDKNEMDSKIVNKYSLPYLSLQNWLIAIYACLTNLPLFVLAALWGNLYIHTTDHIDLPQAAFITSMIFIGNMVGAPFLGVLSDYLGHRKKLMIAAACLYFISLISIYLYTGSNTLILEILFFGLGITTGAQTLAYASIIDVNESHTVAKATSLVSLLSVGLGAFSQPLFGWLVGNNNNYNNGLYFLMLSAMLAIIISVTLHSKIMNNRI